MKFYTQILVVLLTFLGCSESRINSVGIGLNKSDSISPEITEKQINTDTNILIIGCSESDLLDTNYKEYHYNNKNIINPRCFRKLTNIYCKPDTSSQMLARLTFNTTIKLTESNGKWYDWYEIEINKKKGYIRLCDFASNTFSSIKNNKQLIYFIVTDFSKKPFYDKKKEAVDVIIYKYDYSKKMFVDTFEIVDYKADIIKRLNSSNWKNVDLLLFYEINGACCGCTRRQLYIIDANNKFQKIFTTHLYLDDGGDGEQNYSNVTFPINPEFDSIFYNEYEYSWLFNKIGKPIIDRKGNQKMGVIKNINKYYHWDGFNLNLIN